MSAPKQSRTRDLVGGAVFGFLGIRMIWKGVVGAVPRQLAQIPPVVFFWRGVLSLGLAAMMLLLPSKRPR